jgi:glyoxylase-like metal-dependent hydrolase (beta-lactamase superfamily II)
VSNNRKFLGAFCCGAIAALTSIQALAQPDFSKIEISSTKIKPGLYVLEGTGGGNIGLSVGDDGVLMIDDHLVQLTDKLRAAISDITDQPVKYLLNTHWHFDHTGNNQSFGESGSIIVAHDKVRERMKKGQAVTAFGFEVPPAPAAALPVVTFGQSMTFHVNGDTVEVNHIAPAHTDGDAVVYFLDANVVHLGDLYWNGMYPLVDASSGGSMAGMIAGSKAAMARIDDSTVVIPGHGAISNKQGLRAYLEMLETSSVRIAALKAQGKSVEDIVAAKPLADLDGTWGGGFINPDNWVQIVYSTL